MRNDYVVYIHKNISNGKVYVGQTCNLSERWRNNGKNYFNSIKFYNAIKKYGWNNFTHEVVYSNLNKQAADKLEKELIYKYNSIEEGYNLRRHGRPDEFMDMFDSRGDRFSDRFNESGMGGNDMDRMMRYMRNSMRDSMSGEHFTESEAKYLVADMYHTENGRKYSGEKFDMHKAKEICERYRGILPTSVTAADVYVAINSQYHDYAELFKSWFGDGIEQKIVESAIVFWFKDADCKAENKVVEYLGEY